jgi:hypothetical protein
MIGIYGESFAEPIYARSNFAVPIRVWLEESWVNNLGDTAVSHAFAGTSILWSYWKFLENHEKYDRNIFLVSHPQRADHFGHPNKNFISTLHVAEAMLKNKGILTNPGVPNAEAMLKNKGIFTKPGVPGPYLPNEIEDRVRAFRDYYLYMQDDKVDSTYADLILSDIIHRRPDTIVIPLDPDYPKLTQSVTSMLDYIYLQFRSLFPKGSNFDSMYPLYTEVKTINHLTLEINQLVAEHVKRALAGEGWKDWGVSIMSPITHSLPLDYYYEKIKR